jgi:hypothetical protein
MFAFTHKSENSPIVLIVLSGYCNPNQFDILIYHKSYIKSEKTIATNLASQTILNILLIEVINQPSLSQPRAPGKVLRNLSCDSVPVPASTQTPRTCRRPVVQPKGFFAELFIQEKMKHDQNNGKNHQVDD